MLRALRILAVAGVLAAAGDAEALPITAPRPDVLGLAEEHVQAFCGPYRCFARPFWRYRSGAGFLPYRRFGFAPARPRFAPFGLGHFGGGGRFGRWRALRRLSALLSAAAYSTVTDLARLRGWSASFPMKTAV